MTSCTIGLATFTQVQPYRSILGTFRKVATPSSGTAYVGPYCMFPTPVEVRYFFGMLSAVTPSPYCQSFYIYYTISFMLLSRRIFWKFFYYFLFLSIYIITYFLILCQELFFLLDFILFSKNNSFSLLHYIYIIT